MKIKSSKFLTFLLMTMVLALVLVGCSGDGGQTEPVTEAETEAATEVETEAATEEEDEPVADAGGAEGEINVVSREDGSGTRGAFIELTGVEDDSGDNTFNGAVIQNSTNGVMSTVSTDPQSIGYASLGSVDQTVKAIKVDGVEATVEDIKSGAYPIARPFNIVYQQDGLDEIGQALVDFIFSEEGQAVVEGEGYIAAIDDLAPYDGPEGLSGQFTIGGSTSVAPVMHKIIEAFNQINPDVEFDVQETGSGAGVTGAIEGTIQLGMASRELKEEEEAEIYGEPIAIDGIAVIVSPDNPVEDISLENLKNIFTGEVRNWEEI